MSFEFRITLLLLFLSFAGFAQDSKTNKKSNCNKDTVLVIADITLCEVKNYINRKDILDAEMFSVNQPDFEFHSCKISSFGLGNNFNLNMSGQTIPLELKQAIASPEIQYKFINMKNILLIDKQNNLIIPTIQNIKIIFVD